MNLQNFKKWEKNFSSNFNVVSEFNVFCSKGSREGRDHAFPVAPAKNRLQEDCKFQEEVQFFD